VTLEEWVIAWLASQNVDAYLVGGCVRDRLLDRAVHDLDVSIAGDGCALARRLADRFGADYYTLDGDRGTGRAILRREDGEQLYVDVAHFRGEDLAADLAGRDFTINALAADVALPAVVIDHHGGLADLEAGVIRPVSDDAIRDDPLRALRAIRLAAQLDFALAKETEELIRRDGAALADVAAERICDELSKLLACTSSSPFLYELDRLGLRDAILPELEPLRELEQPPPHRYPALKHTLESVRALEVLLDAIGCAPAGRNASDIAAIAGECYLGDLPAFAAQLRQHLAGVLSGERPRVVLLKLALLLHDVGKPGTQSAEGGRIRFLRHEDVGSKIAGEALARLRYSRAEVRLVECIVRNHMRPLLLASQDGVSSRAVYRFFRDTEDAGIDILLHALADHLATYAFEMEGSGWHRLVDLVTRMLGYHLDRRVELARHAALLTGRDLLREFGLQSGPQIGELLEAVREAQAVGEVETRAEAMSLVTRLLAK
jgi:tRNA nucleotidyltransferase/poly(A) polymerase